MYMNMLSYISPCYKYKQLDYNGKIKYLPIWPRFCERKINQRLINGNKFNPNKTFMTSE